MTVSLESKLHQLGLSECEANLIVERLENLTDQSAEKIWWSMVQEILSKKGAQHYSFAIHLLLYKTIYSTWNKIPAPAWFPAEDANVNGNVHLKQWMQERNFKHYSELHHWSCKQRAEFWQSITSSLGIVFDKTYSAVVDLSNGVGDPHWFPEAKLNIVNSCFTAAADAIAIIESDDLGNSKGFTYKELNEFSSQVAHNLKTLINKGDAVAIIMPMHFQAVAIYLAVIKAGAQAISIAESFSANEIETRLNIAHCKLVFTQNEIQRDGKRLPLLEKVIAAKTTPIVVLPMGNDDNAQHSIDQLDTINAGNNNCIPWKHFFKDDKFEQAKNHHNPISCNPMDPINILFSSGTTAEPKAIPWNHSTAIKCASDAYFHHNIEPGDRLCWPSSLGWMMGPWSIFATLINGATLALYTGSPNGRSFGEFVQNNKITILGVVPTLVKHWRETACMETLNWSAIKTFTSTGECSNTEDMLYLMYLAGYRPIIEYCGGTEIGGAYITGTLIQPCAPAAFSTAAMGIDFAILDEEGKPSDKGEIAIIPPSVGLSNTLLNNDHQQVYYTGMPSLSDGSILRRHGDQGERFQNGYYRLLGRMDDTMNLSGIKISSAEIERVLNHHPSIYETAAVAVSNKEAGPEQLIIFAVLKKQETKQDVLNREDLAILKTELQTLIKERLNPLFKIQEVKVIEKLPRTTSNKVMRRTLRDEYRATDEPKIIR